MAWIIVSRFPSKKPETSEITAVFKDTGAIKQGSVPDSLAIEAQRQATEKRSPFIECYSALVSAYLGLQI